MYGQYIHVEANSQRTAHDRHTRCSKGSNISLLLSNLLDDTSIWTYANTIVEIERIINITL
jgi:hypothetical protein